VTGPDCLRAGRSQSAWPSPAGRRRHSVAAWRTSEDWEFSGMHSPAQPNCMEETKSGFHKHACETRCGESFAESGFRQGRFAIVSQRLDFFAGAVFDLARLLVEEAGHAE